MVVNVFNPNTQERLAGGSQVVGQSGLHSEFQASETVSKKVGFT
jgi:hypothetical protein